MIEGKPEARAARAVVLGAGGFVAKALADRLARAMPVVRLDRAALDLTARGAADRLAGQLDADDALVFVAAKAPVRTPAMLADNVVMAAAVCAAVAAKPVAHLVYISSDAVYADSEAPLTEESPCAPESLHGIMHVAREAMLREAMRGRALAILRPTLIYGPADPHNGYGPNRFARLAHAGEAIRLFGGGEERRDHILVDDVAEIAARTVIERGTGVLNLATGETHSFRAIAEHIARLAGGVAIAETPRGGPMPHRGYRPFDVAAVHAAFPELQLTPLLAGLERTFPLYRKGALMSELDLLSKLPRTRRDLTARTAARSPDAVARAKLFGHDYFDGPRECGYGGYRYDGRWVPVARDIVAHYGLTPGMRVLDVGCAKGFLVKDLIGACPGLDVWGLDISHYALAHAEAEARGRLVRGHCARLPFADGAFDLVIALDVVHNLDRAGVVQALREIERVGKGRSYLRVDSYRTPAEREIFLGWVLTAQFHDYPEGWYRVFAEAGYRGDWTWTIIG